MGDGRKDDATGQSAERTDPASTYATVVGAALVLFGLAGFFYNSSFASGDALLAEKALGFFYVNGWQNSLHLIAGCIGIALAPLLPRLYCLASGLVWTVLAAGGFFGAHGGEAVPAMAGLIPAGTGNNLLCLLLGGLAFAAVAASRAASPKAPPISGKGVQKATRARNSTRPEAKVEPETSDATGIGRPRSASRASGARRTIN